MRRALPAIGLFILSPFVGEFVLGNLTLPELGFWLVLAPMYGGGALTQLVVAFHVVWSICVPIAIVESLVPDRFDVPWLAPQSRSA